METYTNNEIALALQIDCGGIEKNVIAKAMNNKITISINGGENEHKFYTHGFNITLQYGKALNNNGNAEQYIDSMETLIKDSFRKLHIIGAITHSQMLLQSVKNKDLEAVKSCLIWQNKDNGIEFVNAKNEFGETALFNAVINEDVEMTKLLIDNGTDVNVKNKSGNTPLMLIATQYTTSQNKINIANMLIERGANIYIEDNSGKAVFDIAKTEEMKNIFKKAIQKTYTQEPIKEKAKVKEKKKSKSNDYEMGM